MGEALEGGWATSRPASPLHPNDWKTGKMVKIRVQDGELGRKRRKGTLVCGFWSLCQQAWFADIL